MHRTIRAVLVLVSALLLTSSHAQTSNATLKQWLVDYVNWTTDVVTVDGALNRTYVVQLDSSPETVVFAASALSPDMSVKALRISIIAEDLIGRYPLALSDVSMEVEEDVLLGHITQVALFSIRSIHQPLQALVVPSGVPAGEWKSAYRDFYVYSELSLLWQAMYGPF